MVPEIKRQSIYEQVVEHLQQYILDNSLRPGDRLPTEAELAGQFKVGRQSVREAVRVLESVGMIETRPGIGSRIKAIDTKHLTDHLRFLFELDAVTVKETAAARRVIECGAIPMAIEHADEQDIERMETAIARMKVLTERGETFAEADMAFHQALVAATKNRVMEGFGVMLQDFFSEIRGRAYQDTVAQRQSIEEHEQICEAIRNRDAAKAQRVLNQHLSVYANFSPRRSEVIEK